MDAPLALYRRYRPDTFTDVIGQDHVTAPLSQALDNNRVHHAYLFSGPRGCGKTTSARIMARALNCAEGPISTPCGKCESCLELARGGPGSVDVIEIDAASHGGVDDARDLRERAFFAPMKSRYKVYIIDEAHMVSPQGFNALLKLVEEPPSHLRFIFATTEPDKVIGTIRSRTHHYPFRLVPPRVLSDYLLDLCGREGVEIESTVLPLVVRAGGGSVRDSLSVLDQLIGGSGPEGVTYPLATSLLGYTPDSLLDETIDSLAADDGATLFKVIDKVVDTGQDPRRFAEDLLHRLRDLVVVSAVPHAASRGLLEISDDQADRLGGQASRFGRAELTRAADIVSQGLTDMRGATAPRLLLEMMCARILLPGVDQSAEGLGARVDRLERRLSMPPSTTAETESVPTTQPDLAPAEPKSVPIAAPELPTAHSAAPSDQPAPVEDENRLDAADGAGGAASAKLGLVDVRQLWPGVLDRVMFLRRYAWVLLSQNAHVKAVEDRLLTIGFVNAGARDAFMRSGADEILRQALIDELGVDWRVEAIIDVGGDVDASRPLRPVQAPASPTISPGPSATPAGGSSPATSQRSGAAPQRHADSTAEADPKTARGYSAVDDEIAADDEVSADSTLTSHELLVRELGAKVIDDIRHDAP